MYDLGFELSSLHSKRTTFSTIPHSRPHTPSFLRGQNLQTCLKKGTLTHYLTRGKNCQRLSCENVCQDDEEFSQQLWELEYESWGLCSVFQKAVGSPKTCCQCLSLATVISVAPFISDINAPFMRGEHIKTYDVGLPWWSSGYDSCFLWRGQVPSLVRELDYTHCN